jgi:hypothetical protein
MELLAGPGRFRGDLGVRADYRILTDGASATAVLNRYVLALCGRAGGGPGATSHTVVIGQDGSEQVHGFETFPVVRGQASATARAEAEGGAMQSVATPPGSPPMCARGCAARRPRRATTARHGRPRRCPAIVMSGAEVADSTPDDPLTRLGTVLTEGELSPVDALDARLARLEQAKPAMRALCRVGFRHPTRRWPDSRGRPSGARGAP